MEEYTFIEHIWAIQALFTFVTSCLEKECKRQVEAINTLITFCWLQEARRSYRSKPSALDIRLKQDVKPLSVLDSPSLSNYIPI